MKGNTRKKISKLYKTPQNHIIYNNKTPPILWFLSENIKMYVVMFPMHINMHIFLSIRKKSTHFKTVTETKDQKPESKFESPIFLFEKEKEKTIDAN